MISYIQDVFDKVEPINKFFVEFGSSGVDTEGNTACLREVGFSGILFDGSATPYYENHPQDYPLKPKFPVEIEFITAENVNSVFEKHNIPKDFYFLSIDVDGEDYWIWKALEYRHTKKRF